MKKLTSQEAQDLAYYLRPAGSKVPRTEKEKAQYLRGKELHKARQGQESGPVSEDAARGTGERVLSIEDTEEYQSAAVRQYGSTRGNQEASDLIYYFVEIPALPGAYKCAGHGAEDLSHRACYLPYIRQHGNTCCARGCTEHGLNSFQVVLVQGYPGDRIRIGKQS